MSLSCVFPYLCFYLEIRTSFSFHLFFLFLPCGTRTYPLLFLSLHSRDSLLLRSVPFSNMYHNVCLLSSLLATSPLISWLQSDPECYVHPGIAIKKSNLGDGFGCFVDEPVREGDMLFSIPTTSCLSITDALLDDECGEKFAEIIERAGDGGRTVGESKTIGVLIDCNIDLWRCKLKGVIFSDQLFFSGRNPFKGCTVVLRLTYFLFLLSSFFMSICLPQLLRVTLQRSI